MTQTHLKRCSLNSVILNTSVCVCVCDICKFLPFGLLRGVRVMLSFLATCLMGKTQKPRQQDVFVVGQTYCPEGT